MTCQCLRCSSVSYSSTIIGFVLTNLFRDLGFDSLFLDHDVDKVITDDFEIVTLSCSPLEEFLDHSAQEVFLHKLVIKGNYLFILLELFHGNIKSILHNFIQYGQSVSIS